MVSIRDRLSILYIIGTHTYTADDDRATLCPPRHHYLSVEYWKQHNLFVEHNMHTSTHTHQIINYALHRTLKYVFRRPVLFWMPSEFVFFVIVFFFRSFVWYPLGWHFAVCWVWEPSCRSCVQSVARLPHSQRAIKMFYPKLAAHYKPVDSN